MLGAISSDSASLWLRTAKKSSVQIQVLDAESGKLIGISEKVAAGEESDFTAVVKLNGLEAEHAYRYEIQIDGEQVPAQNTRFRTYPNKGAAASFAVGLGGGAGFAPQSPGLAPSVNIELNDDQFEGIQDLIQESVENSVQGLRN